ncbi:putative thioredoxin-like protein [Candidatus Terasakiella magnetica]|uniref:Putative thioredoxin-like protein n=1 Tax=Candidatus Terasakiella magnetica TaxID=1867952 RepID=A0A1C3RJL9_9PROT|nr:thioredoxin family protein [Candidatus Terasakiella magnetica]SCA57466.1 putative thioredoxin-like protein [Candidatus Terasakiella magnetica]
MKKVMLALCAFVFFTGVAQAEEVQVNDFGLYHQDWFLESFLDMAEDFEGAKEEGKRFAIIWEQKGCPYCKDLHAKTLSQENIRKYMQDNFVVVQMNIWGDRDVMDFDGTEMTEKEFAAKNGIAFTPTIQFLHEDLTGKEGIKRDAARLPGFFRPFHFKAMLNYVNEKMYEGDKPFQRYIVELAQSGKKP